MTLGEFHATPHDFSPSPLTGYLHPSYAASLAEFGMPVALPRCQGWILRRPIPGVPFHDAMSCYPLFSCRDWSHLGADLHDHTDDLVSLAVVTDPFGAYDTDVLKQAFGDLVVPFKAHFVIDLAQHPETFVSDHHRRNIQRALNAVDV
ncbi:MAG: hypothetical protein AB4911_23640, partial [Oscillochloridaceae bacterium umkhey_bin13]